MFLYFTKYALSDRKIGQREMDKVYEPKEYVQYLNGCGNIFGKNVFSTKEEAIQAVLKAIASRRKSIQKEIEKLQDLENQCLNNPDTLFGTQRKQS